MANLTVEQGYAQPKLQPVAVQTLREGDHYALQLAGSMPGGLLQADGTSITLEYSAPWLPGGATLNSETGWLEWTPGYSQHGNFSVPVTLTATYTVPDSGETVTTETTTTVVFNVLNANGAPEFDADIANPWNILEGQPLQVSVFAFDPDNAGFEPKVRLSPNAPATSNGTASGEGSAAPTVTYQVTGLPRGATFDADTMEVIWTPDYDQSGTYYVHVVATDDGDGTGTLKSADITIPIVVNNARPPARRACTVLGSATHGGVQTTLVRVTEAGLKLLRLSGTGAATVRLHLAGDLTQDGVVDGSDSQAWEQAFISGSGNTALADIDGNGQLTQADRQVLYANYGLAANRAPVQTGNTSLGDVLEINLKEVIARKALGWPAMDEKMTPLTDYDQIALNKKITELGLDKFEVAAGFDWVGLTTSLKANGFQLVSKKTANGKPYVVSTDANDPDSFASSGVLYLVPNITDTDLEKLRHGEVLTLGKVVSDLKFMYLEKGKPKTLNLDVHAKDYDKGSAAVFVGDRPLNNPGYSSFTLKARLNKPSRFGAQDGFLGAPAFCS